MLQNDMRAPMPRALHWLLQMFCVALIAACSANSPTAMAEAKKAYAAQDYALSYAKVAEQAQAGDADAQYALGYMMYYGKGTTKDVAGSYDWFRKAAAQGQPQAAKALALLHQAPVTSSSEASAATDPSTVKAAPPVTADAPKPAAAPQPVGGADTLKPTATATPAQVSHAGQYAVQLMGASTSAPLEAMVKQYHLKDAVVVKTQVKGKPWYVLLKGQYSSHDAAKAALQMLPADLKAHHPWVKTLG